MSQLNVIQRPDLISLSGNIKDLILGNEKSPSVSLSPVEITVKRAGKVILQESYYNDYLGRITVELKDIITAELAVRKPVGIFTAQDGLLCDDFSVEIEGVNDAVVFTAIKGGLAAPPASWRDFLIANFLTRQPVVKEVTRDQPEYLAYYNASGSIISVKVKFYYDDGTTLTVSEDVPDDYMCFVYDAQFSRLWSLDTSGKKRKGIIDVWIQSGEIRLTVVQRYIYKTRTDMDNIYLCENSLGGIDTFVFSGERSYVPEIEYTVFSSSDTLANDIPTVSRKYSQHTGIMNAVDSSWVMDFFRSTSVWHLRDGFLCGIAIDESSIEKSLTNGWPDYTFQYRYAEDNGFDNVSRRSILPPVINIPSPAGDDIGLAPRLMDYPDAIIDASLLLLVQSPFLRSWYKTSLSALLNYLTVTVGAISVNLANIIDLSSSWKAILGASAFLKFSGRVASDGTVEKVAGEGSLSVSRVGIGIYKVESDDINLALCTVNVTVLHETMTSSMRFAYVTQGYSVGEGGTTSAFMNVSICGGMPVDNMGFVDDGFMLTIIG